MKSLGAVCAPLTAETRVICSVGSVQSVFSAAEAKAFLDNNPSGVVCETPKALITNHVAAKSITASVTVKSTTVAVIADNRPSFSIDNKYIIYFRLGSHRLVGSELLKVREFSDRYGHGTHMITITGHTDSSGGNAFNHLLSIRRAGTVRDALIVSGVNMDKVLSVSALGEESLRYETSNGRRFVLNRAVELKAYR